MSTGQEGLHLLLIEDNPGDVRLMQEVFAEHGMQNRVSVARDGEEALRLLRTFDAQRHADRPDVIILDLNLPRKDGREVLKEIKSDVSLRRIPVIVLTTSNSESDIAKAYDLHANCYILKPVDLDDFIAVVKEIETFWLKTVQLPRKPR